MSESSKVRLVVDGDKCQGHNRCKLIAPDLIDVDDLGFAHARGDGVVAAVHADAARKAVRNCPEFALRLEPVKDGE